MYWLSSSGYLELELTFEQAQMGAHPGPCDADVEALRQDPGIRAQLEALDPAQVRDELKGYGAWDDEELADHDANLSRILWIACGDVLEEAKQGLDDEQ